jgi:hypothetical protein
MHGSVHNRITETETTQMKHEALRNLDRIEGKLFRTMMNGPEADACTIRGQEGKNYIAYCKAAADCAAYREKHDLVGVRGYKGR